MTLRGTAGDRIPKAMEDPQPEFTPMITEDQTPGVVVVLSPRLAARAKARGDAQESAAGSDGNEQDTPTTS